MLAFARNQGCGQFPRQSARQLGRISLKVVVEEHVDEDEALGAANDPQHRVENLLVHLPLASLVDPRHIGEKPRARVVMQSAAIGDTRRQAVNRAVTPTAGEREQQQEQRGQAFGSATDASFDCGASARMRGKRFTQRPRGTPTHRRTPVACPTAPAVMAYSVRARTLSLTLHP